MWRPLWLVAALLWSALVLFFSLQPSVALPGIFHMVQDFVLHFGAYVGISFLLMGYSRSQMGPIKVSVLSFGFGLGVEFLQPIVAQGRIFSWYDVLANSVGIAIGIVFALIVRKLIFTPNKKKYESA